VYFPFPTTLAGTVVTITAGGAQSKAVILYTSALQVAAILPSTIPVGKAAVAVTFGDATSPPGITRPDPLSVLANHNWANGVPSQNRR